MNNLIFFLFFFFFLLLSNRPFYCQSEPFALRISCGAQNDIHTQPTNTVWSKDFGFLGGKSANGTRPSFITPPLNTVRYFPLSEGPENCYNIKEIPVGHYSVRSFFGMISDPNFDTEPLFDVSIGGTLIYSLKPGWSNPDVKFSILLKDQVYQFYNSAGWSNHDDEQAFMEALVYLSNGSASICFHSTGHGEPAILSIEILQINDTAYSFSSQVNKDIILKTDRRMSCGNDYPKYDVDYNGDHWGGDRFWNPISSFDQDSNRVISTTKNIKQASKSPNFYPEAIYQMALQSTDNQMDLVFVMDVDPNRNYSIWLHFAEIDDLITGVGQRVFDIVINGDVAFQDIDIVDMSGDLYTALVLNKTVAVSGRTLTITMSPNKGHATVSAIEIFEVIASEMETSSAEVKALHILKTALGLPLRFGWNGDPCVPKQHPWVGVDCQFDKNSSKWVIDGIALDNQGLSGFFPNDISNLSHLQSINLSGNSIHGAIPNSIGTLVSLKTLDLSYNLFNGSIPESFKQLTSIQILNLNENSLAGRVPAELGERLLHRASFNFTDNTGLCGFPGLPSCGPHLSVGAQIGIAFGSLVALFLILSAIYVCRKRKQNVLRAQRLAARAAPYAKAKTHFSQELHLTRHHGKGHTRIATENGPSLLS